MARPLPFVINNYTSGYALRPVCLGGTWSAVVQNGAAAELHKTAEFATKEEAYAAARAWLEGWVRFCRTQPGPLALPPEIPFCPRSLFSED